MLGMRTAFSSRLMSFVVAVVIATSLFLFEPCVADSVDYRAQNNCLQCREATPTLPAALGILRLNWAPLLTVDKTECQCSWAIQHPNNTQLAYMRIVHSMHDCFTRNTTTLRVLCLKAPSEPDELAVADVTNVNEFVSVFNNNANLCGFMDSGAIDVTADKLQSCYVEFKRNGTDSFSTRDGFEIQWAFDTDEKTESPLHILVQDAAAEEMPVEFLSPVTLAFVGTLLISGVYVIFGWKSHAQLNAAYIAAEARRRELDNTTPGAAVVSHGGVRPINTTSTIGAALDILAQRSRARSRLESGAFATPVSRGSMLNMNLDTDVVPAAVVAPFRARRAERLSVGEQTGLRRVLDHDGGGDVGDVAPSTFVDSNIVHQTESERDPKQLNGSETNDRDVSGSTDGVVDNDAVGAAKQSVDIPGESGNVPAEEPQDEQTTTTTKENDLAAV